MTGFRLTAIQRALYRPNQDDIAPSQFTVFELDELMGLGEDKVLPVLAYLFRRIERAMDGRPTLLLLDEAWQMLSHPVFAEKLSYETSCATSGYANCRTSSASRWIG